MGELPVGLVECPHCEGAGGFDYDWASQKCEECDGTGSILEDCLSPDQDDLDEKLEGFLSASDRLNQRYEETLDALEAYDRGRFIQHVIGNGWQT